MLLLAQHAAVDHQKAARVVAVIILQYELTQQFHRLYHGLYFCFPSEQSMERQYFQKHSCGDRAHTIGRQPQHYAAGQEHD